MGNQQSSATPSESTIAKGVECEERAEATNSQANGDDSGRDSFDRLSEISLKEEARCNPFEMLSGIGWCSFMSEIETETETNAGRSSELELTPAVPFRELPQDYNSASITFLFDSSVCNREGECLLSSKEWSEISLMTGNFQRLSAQAGLEISLTPRAANGETCVEAFRQFQDILYISGHGDSMTGAVIMSSGRDHSEEWNETAIADLCAMAMEASRGEAEGCRFCNCLILGACYSEDVGRLFLRLGRIPHVVAVKRYAAVRDESIEIFVQKFMNFLLSGLTVRDAFLSARRSLSAQRALSGDATNFILLPDDDESSETHAVQLFPERPSSRTDRGEDAVVSRFTLNELSPYLLFSCGELPPRLIPRVLPAGLWEAFHDPWPALILLTAAKGSGVSLVVQLLLHRLRHRCKFRGIFHIRVAEYFARHNMICGSEYDFVRCIAESVPEVFDGCVSIADVVAIGREIGENDRFLLALDGCNLTQRCIEHCRDSSSEECIFDCITRLVDPEGTRLCVFATTTHHHSSFFLSHALLHRFELEPMSHAAIASQIFLDAAREIRPAADLRGWESHVRPSENLPSFIRAAEIFAGSAIVQTLQQNALAARFFVHGITSCSLVEAEADYVRVAQRCLNQAIIFPYHLDSSIQPVGSSMQPVGSSIQPVDSSIQPVDSSMAPVQQDFCDLAVSDTITAPPTQSSPSSSSPPPPPPVPAVAIAVEPQRYLLTSSELATRLGLGLSASQLQQLTRRHLLRINFNDLSFNDEDIRCLRETAVAVLSSLHDYAISVAASQLPVRATQRMVTFTHNAELVVLRDDLAELEMTLPETVDILAFRQQYVRIACILVSEFTDAFTEVLTGRRLSSLELLALSTWAVTLTDRYELASSFRQIRSALNSLLAAVEQIPDIFGAMVTDEHPLVHFITNFPTTTSEPLVAQCILALSYFAVVANSRTASCYAP